MDKKFTVRITHSDYTRLKEWAEKKEISLAQAVRELIDKIK